MAYFTALSQNLPGDTEEDHEKFIRVAVLGPRIKPETSRIRMLSTWLRRVLTYGLLSLTTFCIIELLLLVVFSLLMLFMLSLLFEIVVETF
jgi:hypothetical protein